MGFITKALRRVVWHMLSCITCAPDIVPEEDQFRSERQSSSNSNNDDEKSRPNLLKRFTARSFSVDENAPNNVYIILYISIFYDMLDYMNLILDVLLLTQLFQIEGRKYYPALLLVGIVLARLIDYRGSTLLFRHGMDWHPFWIQPKINPASIKNQRVFAVLYCLVFTEAAVFLFEDYPSLVVYSQWMVVAFPPPVLETMDDINVAFSAVSLAVLLILFLAALVSSLYFLIKLEWDQWTKFVKAVNVVKIAAFMTGAAFLARFVIDMVILASETVFADERDFPENKILGISICDAEDLDEDSFCDEKTFIIRVAIAWAIALLFSLYLIFRPAFFELGAGMGSSSSPSQLADSRDVSTTNNDGANTGSRLSANDRTRGRGEQFSDDLPGDV